MSPHFDPDTELDQILAEVREMLTIEEDAGDLDELVVLQMLLQVTRELHETSNIHDLITNVLDSAIAFTGGERAFVMLLEEESASPRFKMGRDEDGNYLKHEDFSPSLGVIQQVLDEQHTIIVPDTRVDETLNKRESIVEGSLRTIMCSPLMIKRRIVGLLYIDSTHQTQLPFTGRSYINFLASLADQSAVAIHNAQKFETLT